MSDEVENTPPEAPDQARRRMLWRALGAAPVILTLSTSPAWASHVSGHYGPPPGCDPPPKPTDPNCNPND